MVNQLSERKLKTQRKNLTQTQLKITGSHDERNGKEIEEKGSQLRSANEGYTAASTELRKENGDLLQQQVNLIKY